MMIYPYSMHGMMVKQIFQYLDLLDFTCIFDFAKLILTDLGPVVLYRHLKIKFAILKG
jgi:hypothetical protein